MDVQYNDDVRPSYDFDETDNRQSEADRLDSSQLPKPGSHKRLGSGNAPKIVNKTKELMKQVNSICKVLHIKEIRTAK